MTPRIGCCVALIFLHANADTSCKHRTERRLGQNPYIHNPYLRRALREYITMHANATGGGRHVAEDLKKAASDPVGSVHRYVYLELSASGLGNRINALLSGFLYALLSRRVLLVSTGGYALDDLLCQPFDGGDWLWPNAAFTYATLVTSAAHGDRFLSVPGHNWEMPERLFAGDYDEQSKVAVVHFLDHEMYHVPVFFASSHPQRLLLDQWFPSRKVRQ
jgi:hypothetical protein